MKKKFNLVIDRFEEDLAVLLDEKGEEIILPEKYLPKGLAEGDILGFEIWLDKKTTMKKKKEIRRLIDRLKKRQ